MYFIENYKRLGENKTLIYCNKYINNIQLGCNYTCNKYKIFCPEYINDINSIIVPEFFKNMINITL